MASTLIIILFLLNFITIFAMVLLYMRQNRLIDLEKQQRKNYEESEELLSSFLYEIKEENERFMEKVYAKERIKQSSELKKDEKKTAQFNHIEDTATTEQVLADLFVYDSNEIEEETLIETVKKLQKQGMNIDQIAKKLNKGKTEIALLLKFQK